MSLNIHLENPVAMDSSVDINAEVNAVIDSSDYDMAFYFVGDWLSGDYIQTNADVDSVSSNLVLSQNGINTSYAFMLDAASVDSGLSNRSGYGNEASGNKALRVTSTSYSTMNDTEDISSFVSFNSTDAIPMINQSSDLPSGSNLASGNTSIGDALLNAVSQALFKRAGRNSAINNDSTLKTELQASFFTALDGQLAEASDSYEASRYFKRYIESGRYSDDTGVSETNAVNDIQNYNVNDTIVKMIVRLTGNVTDTGASAITLTDTATSVRIFGDDTASPPETQVNAGAYSTDLFVAFRHDERL
jgi:hypothetical protein